MLLVKTPTYLGRQTIAVITWSCGGAEQGAGVSVAMTCVGTLESSQGEITHMSILIIQENEVRTISGIMIWGKCIIQ